MDFTKFRKRADLGLRKTLRYIQPATKVLTEATKLVSTIAKPTPLAVSHAVVSGINTLSELIQVPDETPEWSWPSYIPQGLWTQALQAAGYRMEIRDGKKGVTTRFHVGEQLVQIDPAGTLRFWANPWPVMLPKMVAAIDDVLPPHMLLKVPERDGDPLNVKELQLTHLRPVQMTEIMARTRALLGERRAILLDGRPGVGKTTIAMAIAAEIDLGRVLIMDNAFMSQWRISKDALRMLNVGVIIVDDIDKVKIGLGNFESLRDSCRLLICTANNGAHDSVIDGALARPARLDEVFTIAGVPPFKRPPFDRLPDRVWDVVSQWPQAYLNELELRLLHTPNDLRLRDLEARLERRTSSAAGLLEFDFPIGKTGSNLVEPGVPVEREVEIMNQHDGFKSQPIDDYDPT